MRYPWKAHLDRFLPTATPEEAAERRTERLQRNRELRAMTDPYEPERPNKPLPWLTQTEIEQAQQEGDL